MTQLDHEIDNLERMIVYHLERGETDQAKRYYARLAGFLDMVNGTDAGSAWYPELYIESYADAWFMKGASMQHDIDLVLRERYVPLVPAHRAVPWVGALCVVILLACLITFTLLAFL